MSEIKVNSIKGVGASDAAITVNNTDGTCTANITNNLSNRNLIINGACLVAQRGPDATGVTANGYATVDRFYASQSGTDEYIEQHHVDIASGTTPYTLGFRKAFQIKNGNQTGGAGAGDYIRVLYLLEAQDLASSGWNYKSSSSYITLSFWVKSSVAQTYYFNFRTYDGTQKMYCFSQALSADTWTKVTHSIPGHADLSFDNDANAGMYIQWYMFRGTNNTGTVTLNQWNNYDSSILTPDQTSTWYTTNNATYEITGLQLEAGSVATDFEHRSYAQELALCERYCQIIGEGTNNYFATSFVYASDLTIGTFTYKTTMRASPSLVQTTGTNYYFHAQAGTIYYLTGFTGLSHEGARSSGLYTTTSVGTVGQAGGLSTVNSAAQIRLEAEL